MEYGGCGGDSGDDSDDDDDWTPCLRLLHIGQLEGTYPLWIDQLERVPRPGHQDHLKRVFKLLLIAYKSVDVSADPPTQGLARHRRSNFLNQRESQKTRQW